MDTTNYPTSIAGLKTWAKVNEVTTSEARVRFVQFVILVSIGASPKLRGSLSLKGGNALRFVHGNRRSTSDLDFSADSEIPDDEDRIRQLLSELSRDATRRFGLKLRCQSIHRNPKKPGTVFPTFNAKIGFQFPGDNYYTVIDDLNNPRNVHTVVELEISLNDVVCEYLNVKLSEAAEEVRVCSLEDVLAEKLRALLQQPIRKRNRPQDVYDIASRTRACGASLDLAKISRYLQIKAEARGVAVSKSAFNEAIRQYASVEYDKEIEVQNTLFISFDEAWAETLLLVNRLTIPD